MLKRILLRSGSVILTIMAVWGFVFASGGVEFNPLQSVGILAGISVVTLVVTTAIELAQHYLDGFRMRRMKRAFAKIKPQLNALNPDEARIVNLLEAAPSLSVSGVGTPVLQEAALLAAYHTHYPTEVRAEQIAQIQTLAAQLRTGRNEEENREHAILLRSLQDDDLSLSAFSCDYGLVKAYRDTLNVHLRRLSGNALLASAKYRHVFLHKRAEGTKGGAYPGAYHIVGGNHEPRRDKQRLSETMQREVGEEFELPAEKLHVVAADCPVLLFEEPNTRWQAVLFMGVEVPEKAAREVIDAPDKAAHSTDEGQVIAFDYKDLADVLTSKLWVPSGRAALLAWVAIGAPVSGKATMDAKQIQKILTAAGVLLGST